MDIQSQCTHSKWQWSKLHGLPWVTCSTQAVVTPYNNYHFDQFKAPGQVRLDKMPRDRLN